MGFTKYQMRIWGIAAGGLALAAGLVFYLQGIAPLRRREAEAHRSVAALQQRIADADRMVVEVRAMEARAGRERREFAALMGSFPAGPALVWFPEQMKAQFGRSGGVEVVTRLNTTRPVAGLPDFQRTYWAVQMPVGNATSDLREICLAIAALDLSDPFLRVVNATIRPDANDLSRHLAVINIAVLSPKVGASR